MNDQRIKILHTFLQKDPNDAFTLYSIAYEYAKADQYPEAIRFFERLQSIHPNYVGLYYHLGKALEKTEATEKAEKVYREGMSRAQSLRERHVFSELQGALNSLLGLDYEDEV